MICELYNARHSALEVTNFIVSLANKRTFSLSLLITDILPANLLAALFWSLLNLFFSIEA